MKYWDSFGAGDNPEPVSSGVGPAGATFAFASVATNAAGQVVKVEYNYSLGAVTGVKDPNNVVTKTEYDDRGRPVKVTAALGLAEQSISDMAYPSDTVNEAKISKQLDATRWLSSKTSFDGFDRPVLSSAAEDGLYYNSANYTIFSKTVYDPLGRAKLVTNPYRAVAAATDGWSRSSYDLAGRVTEVATFAGGVANQPPDTGTNSNWTGSVTSVYASEVTTVTDQAGKRRQSVTDALGRLIQVYEAPNDSNYNHLTSYGYDTLDNLTSVSQGSQTRTFVYNSLKRLTSAANPESGTISYQYDDNGNLTVKTDARGVSAHVSAHYAYDALNRPVRRWYNGSSSPTEVVNNNPALPSGVAASDEVNFYYDSASLPSGAPTFDRGYATGRLVAVTYGGGSAGTYRGYDALGQVIRQYQQTDAVNYLVEASYNVGNAMTSETYPSAPGNSDRLNVNMSYDDAGRLASLSGGGASLSQVTYAAHGALAREVYGNNLAHTISYNNRLQVSVIKLATYTTRTALVDLDLVYNYGTTNNNGNLQSETYLSNVSGLNYTQNFSYDSLNRLATATETAGGNTSWTQSNGYDRYGNRGIDLGNGQQNLSFNPSNNRITTSGYSYDDAGNLLTDGAHSYTYDAENKVKTVDGTAAYVYDGEGQRVRKLVGENLRFVYDMQGKEVAEFDGANGTLQKEYIYGASGLLATIAATGANAVQYLTADHLGSPRVVTTDWGQLVSRHDYLPFGEELFAGSGGRTAAQGYSAADGVRQKFTSKERDNETGLDYFLARYYSSTQGRFTSADPVFFQAAMTVDPQRFNLYAYARNNPLKFTDPEGEAIGLSSDKDERERELAALRLAVGKQAGAYLYGNLEKDGKYYVGVYTNGPDGKGKDFKDLNEVTGEIAPIIADTKVASLEIVAVGTQITGESGDKYTMTPSENCNCIAEGTTAVAGLTMKGADANHFRILLPMSAIGSAIDPVPEEQMSNDKPGKQDWGIVMGHEMGHVQARMTGDPNSNGASLRLENKVRMLRDKNAPTIDYHSRREALKAKSTMVSP